MISWLLGIDENLSPLPLRDVFDKLLQGKHFISDHSTLDLPVLTLTLGKKNKFLTEWREFTRNENSIQIEATHREITV